MQVAHEAFSGGINQTGGPKTNYSALYLVESARTLGQINAVTFSAKHFSNGDTIGLDGYVQSWGRNNAGGDEGTEAITVGAYQGDTVMTAMVAAVAGNQITYASVVNENTRGEQRPLIITTPAKVYSSGNIVSVSGAPPTVTGDGNQNFTTLGAGPVSNLFISIDSQANGALKLVVPVRSITDATHVVIDYVSEGVDAPLPVPALPSTYKIFRGGTVTALSSPSGSMTVVPADDFAVGDTVEQPLGYAHTITGLHLSLSQKLPFSSNAGGTGISVVNIGSQPFTVGMGFNGSFATGLQLSGITADGIRFTNDLAGALLKSSSATPGVKTNFLGAFTAVGQNTFFSYDRSVDVWKTTAPIMAPSFQTPIGIGVDCIGPPTINFRVSKGIVTSC